MAVSPDDPNRNERTPRDPTPIDAARRSRLDREVNEILAKAQRDAPLPPTPISSRRKQPTPPATTNRARQIGATIIDTLLTVPLLTALGFGIACAVVAPSSRLLATIFAILALAMVVLPYVRLARRASQPGNDGPKMWRGQVMDAPRRPEFGQETPADKISHWFNNRRR